MNAEAAVVVEHVSKKYCKSLRRSMLYGCTDIAREVCGLRGRPRQLRRAEFWALQDVSFELRRSEWLGVIGANGAGKSTLLKQLNGIMRPDAGRIELRGRVSALIELGAGFHPLLTGRENIYVQGAMMGKSRREIDEKFDQIVEFSGIGDFLDSPVKFYSSGMHARLGFSIPIHFDPDILLVDEVLAVGDLSFQEKCMRRMERMRAADKAVLMVSHSLYRIEALCDRALWLDRGRVVGLGDARDVVKAYLDDQERRYREGLCRESDAGPADPLVPVAIEAVELLDADGHAKHVFAPYERMTIRIRYNARQRIPWPLFNIRIFTGARDVFEASMVIDGPVVDAIEGAGTVECRLEALPLTPKVYEVVLFARSREGVAELVPIRTYAVFQVSDDIPHDWPVRGPMAINHLRQGSPVYIHRSWHFFGTGTGAVATPRAVASAPVEAAGGRAAGPSAAAIGAARSNVVR